MRNPRSAPPCPPRAAPGDRRQQVVERQREQGSLNVPFKLREPPDAKAAVETRLHREQAPVGEKRPGTHQRHRSRQQRIVTAIELHRLRKIHPLDHHGERRQAVARGQLPEQADDNGGGALAAGALGALQASRQQSRASRAKLGPPAHVERFDLLLSHLLEPVDEGIQTTPRPEPPVGLDLGHPRVRHPLGRLLQRMKPVSRERRIEHQTHAPRSVDHLPRRLIAVTGAPLERIHQTVSPFC